jgi:beta-1,4-N-acetylglucosaminyltransferase
MIPLIGKHKQDKAIICNFGTGGHNEQMKRLISHLTTENITLISQSPVIASDSKFNIQSKIYKVRPEYSTFKGILAIPFFAIHGLLKTIKLFIEYDIRIFISTGPGIAIVPSIISKIFGSKVIYFESWSRFTKPSISGLLMYRIADVFFVQNEEIKKFYKNAHYMGRL